uniref:BPI2 domain-containing protein n=1 Tax=Meloidogyne hapla TaxID=6305 RepID=A0A1I8BFQ5_MELHA
MRLKLRQKSLKCQPRRSHSRQIFKLIQFLYRWIDLDETSQTMYRLLLSAIFKKEKCLLNEQLATLRGFRAQHPFDESGIRGNIFVSDVQTLSYRPPTQSNLHFVPPHFLLFSIENAAITLSGRFHGDAGPLLQIPGTVFGQLQGLNVEMATQLRAVDGSISVSVAHCRTNLRFSQFTINPEGLLGPILKIFESTINDLIRQRIPDLLCRSLRDIVERNSPQLFQRITFITLGEHFANFGNGTDGVIER